MQQGMQQGRREELLEMIESSLRVKFGADGLSAMPDLRLIEKLEKLKAIMETIVTVDSLSSFKDSIQRMH